MYQLTTICSYDEQIDIKNSLLDEIKFVKIQPKPSHDYLSGLEKALNAADQDIIDRNDIKYMERAVKAVACRLLKEDSPDVNHIDSLRKLSPKLYAYIS